MSYALQRCCTTPVFLKQYEMSTDALLKKLGVDYVDIKEFGCCGYPLKNFDHRAYLLSSAKNLALAEKGDHHILTFCNCCFGSLKHAAHSLENDPSAKEDINKTLSKEGLEYSGRAEVRHLTEVLYHDVGLDKLKEKILKPFKKLKIATQYGCHVLRPRKIMKFDDPLSPSILDRLVEVTGAESIPWSRKLECCGSPQWGINDELSMDLTEKKIKSAAESGADYLCMACPYCQLQFDRVQSLHISKRNGSHVLPPVLYTQLLGFSLGITPEDLGIGRNELDISGIAEFV